MYAALFGIIAIRAKVCVRARQRYGRRVERYGVHVRKLGFLVVVHDVVEVVTAYTAVMLHILRVALDGQLQPQYLVGHRLHGLGCGRVRALSCQSVGYQSLSVGEVGQQGVDGLGRLNDLRKAVGVLHEILIRPRISVAYGEVVGCQVDGRQCGFYLDRIKRARICPVDKFNAEQFKIICVSDKVWIQAIWKFEMRLPS